MVTVPFPHLSGLVAAARVNIDERVPTVGVFASGRMVANPAFVAKLKDNELVFVLAQAFLSVALTGRDRALGTVDTMPPADMIAFQRARLQAQAKALAIG